MVQEIINAEGKIVVSKEVLATYAGIAATDCFGVIGMVAKNIKDGIGNLLGRESISKGVEISEEADGVNVKLYIIVGYGTKISEIASNVIQRVQYTMNTYTGLEINKVQVIVQGVRVLD